MSKNNNKFFLAYVDTFELKKAKVSASNVPFISKFEFITVLESKPLPIITELSLSVLNKFKFPEVLIVKLLELLLLLILFINNDPISNVPNVNTPLL